MTAQTQSTMPLAGAPMVDEAQNPSTEWFRFFTDTWQKLGRTTSTVQSAAFLQKQADGSLSALGSADAVNLGSVFLAGKPGGAVQAIATPASPVNFPVPTGGQVVCDSNGTLQIKRGASTLSVAGGSVRALAGDTVIISWAGPAPITAFLPDQ